MNALQEWRLKLPEDSRSFKAAAKLLGISEAQLWRYENGQRQVAPERVPHIASITGIPPIVLRPDVFAPIKQPPKHRSKHRSA